MNLQIRNFLHGPYSLFNSETGVKTVFDVAVPHKWLPGDTVLPTGEIVTRGAHTSIVGIVDFCNRTGQGFTHRGVPLYLFYPLNAGYPPFLVSAKTKPATNMIALVNYEHWETKWPRGGIQRVLGTVGDKRIEKYALQHAAGIQSRAVEMPIALTVSLSMYDDRPWDIVTNIDPAGCEDIDDVFAWRTDGTFAIGIADVSAFVDEGTALDLLARNKGTSVYENTEVVDPMFPTWLSAGIASLKADGSPRPVLALVWSPGSTEPEWRRLAVVVNRPHTYESVLADSEICSTLPTLLSRSLHCTADIGTDPHKWVEAAMIEYNRRAGELLAGAGLGLLRVHLGVALTENAALARATECPALAWRGAAAGFYVAAGTSEAAHGHAGLGIGAYAHASSPLRRYADLVNQRVLKHILGYMCAPPMASSGGAFEALAFHLNERGRIVKEYELRVWFLSALRTDTITETEGICCEYLALPTDAWVIYVPAWRRFVRARAADGVFPIVGQKRRIRAFCDLREVVWDRRCVCAII